MVLFFFFQAEDGIRDYKVTGVQTCALPISLSFAAPAPLVALGEEGFTTTMDESTYSEAVLKAKEYIAAGDAYQIVVSRRLDTPLGADPFTVYRALRTINPSPYLFFLRLGKTTGVGSSPQAAVRPEA